MRKEPLLHYLSACLLVRAQPYKASSLGCLRRHSAALGPDCCRPVRSEKREREPSSVRSAAFTTRLQQSPVSCFVRVGLRSCGCACASGICGAYTVSCSCVGSLSLESALVITPTMIVSVMYIIVTILKRRNFLIINLFRFIIRFIYTCSV